MSELYAYFAERWLFWIILGGVAVYIIYILITKPSWGKVISAIALGVLVAVFVRGPQEFVDFGYKLWKAIVDRITF